MLACPIPLDRYLRARGLEKDKEEPLLRVENQPYVHYSKGSLVMYEVQDLMGEDKVDEVLAGFVRDFRFRGPPYPTSRILYDRLRAAAGPALQEPLADLFERITLFDAHTESASAHEVEPGVFDVTIDYVAHKLHASELGAEVEAPLDDDIAFGALDDSGKALAIERRHLTANQGKVTLRVHGKPAKAGIDPLNMLVDRKPEDNVTAVELR